LEEKMFENIISFFKKMGRKDALEEKSKDTAKERLQLVLTQDRANVSADFLDMMRQEIIDIIKKYIDVDENQIDVKLTNRTNEDGTIGAPALYANIPIAGIKEHLVKKEEPKAEENKEEKVEEKEVVEETKNTETEEIVEDVKEKKEKQENKEEVQDTKEITEKNAEEATKNNPKPKSKSKKNTTKPKQKEPKKDNQEKNESEANKTKEV
jgi:cell division topological specificity factor minE